MTPRDPDADSRDAERLRDLDVNAHLGDPARKQSLVTPLFDVIAPRYDRFTRLFSFGMDRGWKREAIRMIAKDALAQSPAPGKAGATILDLACGTGDLAFAVAAAVPNSRVTGIDTSERMIERAERRRSNVIGDWSNAIGGRLEAGRITFKVGSMAALDAADASVDAVTVGYGIRNAPETTAALEEIARVLKPGGHLVTLDFFRPESSMWRGLFLWYLGVAGSIVGWLWHRVPMVYGYIAPSIEHFMSWQEFSRTLESSGFKVVAVRPKLFGGVAIHHAVRREDEREEARGKRGKRGARGE